MNKVNILVVDDRDENLVALEAVLNDPTYRIVRARSGREALREVLEQDFALILLDVVMPNIDGYETATLIRERPRSKQTPDHLPDRQRLGRVARVPRLQRRRRGLPD